MLRLLRLISFPQLRATWGRTLLVIGGISTGVSLIVAINVINSSVLMNFQRTIDLIAGPAALEITLGVGEVGFAEAVSETARVDPGVVASIPLVRGTITFADDSGETLQLFGADLTAEEDLQRYRIVGSTTSRAEVLRSMADPTSILLTTAMASRRGIGLGDVVRFSTPQGVRPLTVRGLLETEGLASVFGGALAVMDLPSAQLVLGKTERVDQIDLVLKPDVDVAAVRQRLQAALPRTLTVERPAQRGAQYESILASFQAMLTGLSLLCLVAGIYIVYNTTSTGAAQRGLVMAGLRIIGADSGQLFRLLQVEALILGVIGTLVGIPVGLGLAKLLTGMVADSLGVIFQLRFPLEILVVDYRQQAAIAIVGVVAALFASFFAARRIRRLEPLDVIRADFRSIELRASPGQLFGWWLVLVAVSAAALAAEVRFQSIAWGNFGSTLWNASVVVIAIPIVTWSAGALSYLLPRVFGAEGRVAAASFFRAPARTGVTVAAVTLVLTVGITVSCLALSHRRSIDSYIGGFLASDLVVSAVATEGGWLETPIPESIVPELVQLPGVRTTEMFRILPGHMYRGERIAVAGGTDGNFEPARYPARWYREGDPLAAAAALRAGTGVNVSTGLADRFNLRVGDTIELDTPTGALTLPIVGVVRDYMSDRGSVIMNRRVLVDRWRETAVSRINVFLEPGASLEEVRSAIATRFHDRYRLKILSLNELLTYMGSKINRAFAFTNAIQLLVAIVTVAGIFDLLLAAILERRRELAVWRLIGADERSVRRSVVLESATVGGIGIALGLAVGMVTAWLWVAINFRYLLGYYLDYHVDGRAILWYATLVLAMTMLAGYAAASRANRQSVLEGIQKD